MSTSTNLPAGFSITSINGQRCTAVARASTTLNAADAASASAVFTVSSTTTSIAAAPNVGGGGRASASSSAAVVTVDASTTSTTSTTAAAVSSTIATSVEAFSSTEALSTSTSTQAAVVSATALPASKGTTPTTSSTTAVGVAQSDTQPSATLETVVSSKETPSQTFVNSSPATTSDQSSTASSLLGSNSKVTAAPVVGGVIGGVALIALLSLLLWALRRRRRIGRESLLTPLGTGLATGRRSEYYDDKDGGESIAGEPRWRTGVGYQTGKVKAIVAGLGAGLAGIGASLKSKVVRDRSDTPSVNMNRGNSQFLDGPVPTHSRNNSVLSNGGGGDLSVKDRLGDWWERLGESISFKMRLRRGAKEEVDPFAEARGMTAQQANAHNTPDFSQLLGMGDRDLQLRAERRRASMSGTGSVPQIGSLGLDFSSDDPFADPIKASQPTKQRHPNNPFADPKASNPFEDPSRPERAVPRASTYISDIRRSRGQSIDAATTNANNTTSMYRPTNTAPSSRYPSTIAPTRDSYRDTMFSSFTATTRKGKGRSDPFDLERPELWRPRENAETSAMYHQSFANAKDQARASRPREPSAYMTNKTRQQSLRVQSTASYTSKYSSGVSSLADWGEPGPDLGPGSSSSSLKAQASSDGGSTDFSAGGKLAQKWDAKRGTDNVSPQSMGSKASSKNGVGKAM